jgi:SpoIIAA-like
MRLQLQKAEGRILKIVVSGKLKKSDYASFIPETEQRIQQYGRICLLVELHDFHGWEADALWEDVKFDVKHFNDIERIAVVGETTWHEWMTVLFCPFTGATVRYFEADQADQAHAWIEEAQTSSA